MQTRTFSISPLLEGERKIAALRIEQRMSYLTDLIQAYEKLMPFQPYTVPGEEIAATLHSSLNFLLNFFTDYYTIEDLKLTTLKYKLDYGLQCLGWENAADNCKLLRNKFTEEYTKLVKLMPVAANDKNSSVYCENPSLKLLLNEFQQDVAAKKGAFSQSSPTLFSSTKTSEKPVQDVQHQLQCGV